MAIERSFVQVEGPPGTGKTELIERILEANDTYRLGAIRTEEADADDAPAFREIRDDRPELTRYDSAGAATAALIRYNPDRDAPDGLFRTDAIGLDFNEGLLFEGDFPARFPADCTVFVVRPLPEGESLVRERDETDPDSPADSPFDRDISDEEDVRELVEELVRPDQTVVENMAERMLDSATTSTKYRLAEGYDGIQFAEVVAIDARDEDERERGESLAEQLRDLRRDDELYEELLAPMGDRRQITIRVADLSDPDDSGVKDLVRRITREFDRP